MALKYKLIYNPKAGTKRHLVSQKPDISLNLLKYLAKRYELNVDFFATQKPNHATELAKNSTNEGYDVVIAAGGDGTVGEVANGLALTEIPLGILPFGTFMNVATMLSIPRDMEQAMLLIKMGKTRKIDLGSVSVISGEIPEKPYYFLEYAGIGLDANIQRAVVAYEQRKYVIALNFLKLALRSYNWPATIKIGNEKEISVKASLITVANGNKNRGKPGNNAQVKTQRPSSYHFHI